MGFYFRKSVGVGLFRLNFSKRGVGISTGVKGARVVVGPAGTYVYFGRNGFYYKKYLGKGVKNNIPDTNLEKSKPEEIPDTITTRNFENITDSESSEFVQELNSKRKKIRFVNLFGVFPALIAMGFLVYKCFEVTQVLENYQNYVIVKSANVNIRSGPSKDSKVLFLSNLNDKFKLFGEVENNWAKIQTPSNDTGYVYADFADVKRELVSTVTKQRFDEAPNSRYYILGGSLILILLWLIFLNGIDKKRKTISIVYELDKTVEYIQSKMISAFEAFNDSRVKWQITDARRNLDEKHNAGASTTVKRNTINGWINKLPTSFLKTNIEIPCIALKRSDFYFLPDRLLIKHEGKFAAMQYKNLKIEFSHCSFREYGSVPSDATVEGYTYKFVNRDGGPDRRFANNPRIPICTYAEYYFTSSEGINEIIMPSKKDALHDFVILLNVMKKIQTSGFQEEEVVNNEA